MIGRLRAGRSKAEISRITGKDRKTVRKVIKEIEKGNIRPEHKKRASILASYHEKILELIEQDLSSVRIHHSVVIKVMGPSYRRKGVAHNQEDKEG